ncbi:MAG: heparinase II/III family protein [Rikenellaceae bacterium]
MKLNFKISSLLGLMLLAVPFSSLADDYTTARPRLLLTAEGVEKIKASQGTIPAFDASVAEVKASADNALSSEIVVPPPVDSGGGYSHEQHKQNYYSMYHCGIMYQLTGQAEYAEYVKAMLYEYAAMYPTLPLHPDPKAGARGRLFWQTLNENVWLVHTANAYDCVYEYFTEAERKHVEDNLFRPMAEFLSRGNEANMHDFNRIHNHGTWATTGVGLIGYVLGDKEIVDRSLYGLNGKGDEGGFIKQLDLLFSPDGYFTEGAYYQRYAIWPFVVFGQVIDHNQPELNIFNYRDGILKTATRTIIDQSYDRVLFTPNDALEKTLDAQEIVNAINASYKSDPSDKELLSIAESQKKFVVSDAGLFTAAAIHNGEAEPFVFKSRLLGDGPEGKDGALAIIRASEADPVGLAIVFKATSHGLSHGHFDKLSFALYDNKAAVMQDYGAVRFMNIEPKSGGGYTSENNTYAKQTISHNTVVVDQKSHFGGDINVSSNYAPRINFYGDKGEGDKADVQIVSAYIDTAAEGVAMNRTMAIIRKEGEHPIVVDIFKVDSEEEHTYDLPFYYTGHLVESNFPIVRNTTRLEPFGDSHGYQHLWLEGQGNLEAGQGNIAMFKWVLGNRFYSVNTIADENTTFSQVRAGANDPNNNLRNETAIVIREQKPSHTFVSTIEPHGLYDLVMEITADFDSRVAHLETVVDTADHTVVVITMKTGIEYTLCVQNAGSEQEADAQNTVKGSNGKQYTWTGDYALFTQLATK